MKRRIQYAASGEIVQVQWPPEELCAALGDLVFTFATLERTLREVPEFDHIHGIVLPTAPTAPLGSVIESLRQIERRGDADFGALLDRADALNTARSHIVHGYAFPSRVPDAVVLQDDLQHPIDVAWIEDLRDCAVRLRTELLTWMVAMRV